MRVELDKALEDNR
jgi:hypothetical protein